MARSAPASRAADTKDRRRSCGEQGAIRAFRARFRSCAINDWAVHGQEADDAGLGIEVLKVHRDRFRAPEAAAKHQPEGRGVPGTAGCSVDTGSEEGGELAGVEGLAGRQPGPAHRRDVDSPLVFVGRDQVEAPGSPEDTSDPGERFVGGCRRLTIRRDGAECGDMPEPMPVPRAGLRIRAAEECGCLREGCRHRAPTVIGR